jgi:K+-sensing histidine kinase KdpD
LTHDLLHTVAVLNAYAVTLDETWDGLDDGARHDIVRWILRETEQLRELVTETSMLIQIETAASAASSAAAHTARRPIDLAREASDSVADLRGRLRIRALSGAEAAWVRCDGPQIVRLLRTLLSHADRRGPSGTVDLTLETGGDEVLFMVSYLGPTDPSTAIPEDGPDLFAMPPRTGEQRRARLGLYLCGRIAEAHGGRISVATAEHGRTRFLFAMPVDRSRAG